jgi:hypothetical protein
LSLSNNELGKIADAAWKNYKGDATIIESAIGTMFLGRRLGWRPLMLIHDRRTIQKYEKILGISFQESFEPEGPDHKKSIAYSALKSAKDFWKAVKGEIPNIKTKKIL